MASSRILGQSLQLALPFRQLRRTPAVRHASKIPKPRVLEKPERFNPPSHPSRLRTKKPTYGAPLSETEREAQKTRQYPHMMPPEGTFLHWFLTNRPIHAYISISVLVGLIVGTWYQRFIHTTPYVDLLPPNNMFFSHPFKAIRRYWEVYEMDVVYHSVQVNEARKNNVDDVAKRSEYRKAHGLPSAEDSIFGGWTAKSDAEVLGPDATTKTSPVAVDPDGGTAVRAGDAQPAAGETGYVDFEGNVRQAKPWYQFW